MSKHAPPGEGLAFLVLMRFFALMRRALGAALTTFAAAVLMAPGCVGEAPDPAEGTARAPIVGGLGNVTISVAGTVVNRYTALAADAAAGSTTLTVASGAALAPVASGDLLMIMQVQGATIDTTNTATYGNVTALNGAGLYEMVTVSSVSTTTNVVTIDAGCGLRNSYSAAAHTQVIWVPQYAALTVSGAGSITAPAWNGATGGVVAIQATTASLQTAGAINVVGLGFRGGVVKQQTTLPLTGAPAIVTTVITAGSEKGESIAGYHAEYDANGGRYGIGAPANGGGGGGPHNTGGGGGANGNNGETWSGAGVMPGSVTGAGAWALDPDDIAAGGPTNASGGGRGGYSYCTNAENPLTTAPGNAAWGGDDRQEHGGRGGRPLANNPLSQIFMGGGGGSGESNNSAGTSGAPGGGIVYLVANSIDGAGTGSILADGAAAETTLVNAAQGLDGNDAPGGGGGGGAVVLLSPSTTALAVSASGGAGGNQNVTLTEAEGPGGGGGGGFFASESAVVATLVGGLGGTTNSTVVANTFPRDGATDGASGQSAAIAANATGPLCIAADLAIAMSDGGGSVTPGTSVTYTITVTNDGPNPATGATVTDTLSGQLTGASWTCAGAACPAASGSGSISAALGALAAGGTATFTVTATVASSATGTLSNTATVAAPAGIVNPNPANNTATVTNVLAPSADAAVTLTNAPAEVVVNSTYTYTVGVTDAGPSDASTVTVTLAVPAGATFKSASGAGWACTFAAPVVTCTRATLAAGASAPITVTLTAPAAVGSGTATATVAAATADPNSANNTASDTIVFGCALDTDCSATQWCSQGTCTAKLANGQGLPDVTPIDGLCNATNGARVCLSGVCDSNGEVCGIQLGDGTCTTTPECISGVCVTTGQNAGDCETCASDTDCSGSTPACDTTANQCVQCTPSNTSACTGTTPVCSAGETCVACNGDSGSGATSPCPAGNPFCTASGACTNACQTDAECGAGNWCNNLSGPGACQPQVPNGQPVPGGTCTPTLGGRACVSGVCDTNDNECGYANGDGPCTAGDGSVVCQSTICATSGPNAGKCEACASSATCSGTTPVCDTQTNACVACNGDNGTAGTEDCPTTQDPWCSPTGACGLCSVDGDCTGGTVTHAGGFCHPSTGACGPMCSTDADCTGGQWCMESTHTCTPQLSNGTALPSDPPHTNPTLNGTCTPAAATLVCQSGVCDTDNKCGFASGDGPCSASDMCRAGTCSTATMTCGTATQCLSDGDCPTGDFCQPSSHTCAAQLPLGQACAASDQCQSAYCAGGVCSEIIGSGNGIFCAVGQPGSGQPGGSGGEVPAGVGLMLTLTALARRRRAA